MENFKHIKRTNVRVKGRQKFRRIVFRVDDEEYEKFLQNVNRAGTTKSAFLRDLINGVTIKEKPDREFYETMKQMIRIGNNLNQIARKANAYGYIDNASYQMDMLKLEEFMNAFQYKYLDMHK